MGANSVGGGFGCPSDQVEELADAVERCNRQLVGALDRRERVAGWWADKPADFHQKLVLENLDHRVAVAGAAFEAARVALAEAER